MKPFNLIIALVLILLFGRLVGQNLVPMDKETQALYEASIYKSDSQNVHSAIKPFVSDTLLSGKTLLEKKGLEISPVLNSLFSFSSDESLNENLMTAGLGLHSSLSDNLFFQGYYLANRTILNTEDSYFADNKNVIPHFGRFNKNENYNYSAFSGLLSWNSSKNFNFLVGRGKNFWGDGYRSLILSDNSNFSNYLRGSVKVWHFQYIILYSWFKDDFTNIGSKGFENKYSSSHFLSWNISKRLNISFFETVVWPGKDSVGNRGFDINYMNPIVFFRPVEFSLGSPDNILMGVGFKYKWFKNNHIYSQFFIDEFKIGEIRDGNGWWGNKYGLQAGIKGFIKNWHYLAETNLVRPYTYSHHTSYCNYGSYNQPFAHPLGANFKEIIVVNRYFYGNFQFALKAIFQKYGVNENDSTNVGQDIYLPYDSRESDYGNYITQGNLVISKAIEFKTIYYLSKRSSLSLEGGVRIRMIENNGTKKNSGIIFFGLRTGIFER